MLGAGWELGARKGCQLFEGLTCPLLLLQEELNEAALMCGGYLTSSPRPGVIPQWKEQERPPMLQPW